LLLSQQIVKILSSPQSLINVCRPASAILRRLVEADMNAAPGAAVGSSSRQRRSMPPNTVYRFGFDVVFEQMRQEPDLLETVVSRLGSSDSLTALNSMMLINSLLTHSTDTHWEELSDTLERLNIRKAIIVRRLFCASPSHLIYKLKEFDVISILSLRRPHLFHPRLSS
jgi:engulfment and cell motility protein 1